MALPQFLIAATHSGAGKTTLTLGLIKLLQRAGKQVQTFKVGPDFLDPLLHQPLLERPTINLDLHLASPTHLQALYSKYSKDSTATIVEGMMGLYDGAHQLRGSSAEVAQLLGLPVVLVVDPLGMGYSVAALLKGFATLLPAVKIAGVIFNKVSSEGYYQLLAEACHSVGITPLGYLPQHQQLSIASRALGLHATTPRQVEAVAELAAELLAPHLSLDALLHHTTLPRPTTPAWYPIPAPTHYVTAVAYDAAFSFTYHPNLELLAAEGGEVHYFSPLNSTTLPPCQLLYLPGGYPEHYLPALSQNHSIHNAIRHYAEVGGKILAEGGGMLYLGKGVTDATGQHYPMVGLLSLEVATTPPQPTMGYRRYTHQGREWLGNEYRTTRVTSAPPSCGVLHNLHGTPVPSPLLRYKNIIASYTHFYFAEHGGVMQLFD